MSHTPIEDPALERLLADLADRLALGTWMVTRRHGDECAVVAAHGHGFPLEAGQRMPWESTVCARMARREGPRAGPRLADVSAYAEAPAAQELGFAAYVGVPIEVGETTLGTICGVDAAPHQEDLADVLPVLEAWAALVARLWKAELEARTDQLTALPNRCAWEEALRREELRCRRVGHAAAVLAIDLDDFKTINDRLGYAAGDAHLRRAAVAIAEGVREHDVVVRWGGDEFCVLATECDAPAAERLGERVREALDAIEVPAMVGVAPRGPDGLAGAVGRAFAHVAEQKRDKQAEAEAGDLP